MGLVEKIYELKGIGIETIAVYTDKTLDKGSGYKKFNTNGEYISVESQSCTSYPLVKTNIENKVTVIKCDDYLKVFEGVSEYNNFAKQKQDSGIKLIEEDMELRDRMALFFILVVCLISFIFFGGLWFLSLIGG